MHALDRFRRTASAIRVSFAVLLALALATPLIRAGAQFAESLFDDPASASPAGILDGVIAQGVAPLPGGEVAWRVVRDTAEPVGSAGFEQRALGFAFAERDAVLLTDEVTGAQTRLGWFEAAFVADETMQRRESLYQGGTSYIRIALVPADEAGDAGGDEVLYAGDAFVSPGGSRDVDLVKGNVYDGTASVGLPDGAPLLVYAAEGEIVVSNQSTEITLAAGEATTIAGPVQITSLQQTANGATFLVAAIGTEISTA